MVSQAKGGCKVCKSMEHTAVYHNRKPIKRMSIKKSSDAVKNVFGKSDLKIPRKKKTPRASAKDSAWASFSRYIRLRDSLATTGTIDACVCITCNERGDSEPKPYAKIQAGHAIGGRKSSILFHEEITNGQCDYCNAQGRFGLSGDYGNYAVALIKRYGLEHYEELQRLSHVIVQYKTKDFIEIKQRYDEKTRLLLA